jgi:hypothetical protein
MTRKAGNWGWYANRCWDDHVDQSSLTTLDPREAPDLHRTQETPIGLYAALQAHVLVGSTATATAAAC